MMKYKVAYLTLLLIPYLSCHYSTTQEPLILIVENSHWFCRYELNDLNQVTYSGIDLYVEGYSNAKSVRVDVYGMGLVDEEILSLKGGYFSDTIGIYWYPFDTSGNNKVVVLTYVTAYEQDTCSILPYRRSSRAGPCIFEFLIDTLIF